MQAMELAVAVATEILMVVVCKEKGEKKKELEMKGKYFM